MLEELKISFKSQIEEYVQERGDEDELEPVEIKVCEAKERIMKYYV